MGINLLSEKANWILEIVSHTSNEISEDIVTKKYQKFGYYDDKTMLKTLELLDRYASCVAKWNKRNIITITGPISVLASEKIEKKESVRIIIIEYERRNYCADIIFTNAIWDDVTKFDDNSKENCGKKHLDNWNYKNYIKDYKIMGELFKNKLEFLEWYIGFEMTDLLHNSGFDKIKKLDDPNFSKIFQPQYADYECHPNSIHNHGHLATGNLHPHEQGFYLTNSVPQLDKVNSGHWRVIEEYIR
uniref:DNA/RNA non-specific endonuclease domain-containing protein n=1 Tax=Meloidogyne javanica TaxID=6303 RepID=A0A915M700_MELJA